ncbi:MAG: tyrosine-type recombinase/integrase [Beijerinckiaceae bacterium]
MPNVRLTKRIIEALPQPLSGQVLYRDEELTGFGLRVGSKAKSFFAEGQVRRRTIRITIGRYPLTSPEEARRLAFESLAMMSRGVDPTAEGRVAEARATTLQEAFEAFFEAKPSLSRFTIENYKRTPKLYLKDWLKLPLQEITRNMVLTKHRKISKDHGAITANCAFRHLRSVYNFIASLHDEFPANPVQVLSKTRSWAPERRRRTLIAAHQLPAWWHAIMRETEDARDFLLVALFTGMRRNEIATLRWEHIDLIGRTLTVPATKNGDPLVLPLSDFLVDLIAGRREMVGQSEWMFPGPGVTGHIVETKSFTRRVSEASGVSFSLHDLRRTFITVAESLDIPAYALKRLLNHRTDGDVTGGYIVMNVDRLRGPVDRVAARIQELAETKVIEGR